MILFAVFILMVLPFLLGMIVTGKPNHKKVYSWIPSMAELYLVGFVSLLAVFEVISVVCVWLNFTYDKLVIGLSVFFILIVGIVTVFFQKRLQSEIRRLSDFIKENKKNPLFIFWFILLLVQLVSLFYTTPNTLEDITLETILTTLQTNTMHVFHPMTGLALGEGISVSGKLISLPFFYGYFIQLFSLQPTVFLYWVVPGFVIVVSYISYGILAQLFFKKDHRKIWIFLITYGILVFFGDYLFTTQAYRMLHCGFMGETIVIAVFLPFLLGILLKREIPVWRKSVIFILVLIATLGMCTIAKGISYVLIEGLLWGVIEVACVIGSGWSKKRSQKETIE